VRLIPAGPPGRTSRKARAFTAEIGRLHADGYTSEAIRQALSNEGVYVSTATVRREVARFAKQCLTDANRQSTVTREPAPSTAQQPKPGPRAPALNSLSSRAAAEAFFDAHPSNPLLQYKGNP
jgi:hypothetical protein